MLYSAFGTTVSSDLDLGPLPADKTGSPAIAFRSRRVVSLVSASTKGARYESQARTLHCQATSWGARIRVGNMMQFSLRRDGFTACFATEEASDQQIRYWFLQKMLPAQLLLRGGIEILHAGAVEVDSRAVAFTAPSGTGKSTLVRYFLAQGHGLVADEHLVIPEGSTRALPTIPYFRPRREFESLGDLARNFPLKPLPIAAVYVLERAPGDAPVQIESLRAGAAAVALCQRQQFDLSGLGPDVSSQRLARCSRLASTLDVRLLRVPQKLDRLPEVYNAVRNDLGA